MNALTLLQQDHHKMKKMLEEIRSGKFAKTWIEENATGRKWFEGQRRHERASRIEKVGAELRSLMPFLKPVKFIISHQAQRFPAQWLAAIGRPQVL